MNRIREAVTEAIARAEISEDRVSLSGLMSRADYLAVNELLSRLGGKWDKRTRTHLFDRDPRPLLEQALGAGVLPEKNPLCFFETPVQILDMIFNRIDMRAIRSGPVFRTLEPSAGNGAIANRLRSECLRLDIGPRALSTVEIDPSRCECLAAQGHAAACMDFFTWEPPFPAYDLIVMNPPFTAPGRPAAGLDHVLHAARMLAADGLLVAVLPSSWTYRDDHKHSEFRTLIGSYGYWVENPSGSFRATGAEVNTTTIFLRRPRQADLSRIALLPEQTK